VDTVLLRVLDASRRACAPLSEPIVREWSHDRASCRILLAELTPPRVADAVAEERAMALAGGYASEWKVYSHDQVPGLADALLAAGYTAGDPETVLGMELENIAWRPFTRSSVDVRAVRDEAGLADVATISRAIGRRRVDEEMRELGSVLRERPDALSIYMAYAGGEPVSCGRLHYGQAPAVAELAGGRTIATHRNKGYFTAVVAARLREAAERGCRYVFVDALPTSVAILRKLGFTAVTTTQPFTLQGSSASPVRNGG
jgi:N-acetylglutamate synthase-like GNAT family acetyltransferase